ncbi:hypothetical protein FB45DRAFT_1107156 [Roridomyces roridus]|uniref:Jacalin-type lectin domain-containing protein n=1 Tax=Roridomyces roridus TaxID=1738132 RepID=A0AAD7FCQ2_9AGAR|nr:hypothetical protein FB45DRAFT_1107156 [Roridomyces roridus]
MSGLLLAPYNDSMRLGQGFNSFLQTPCVFDAVSVKLKETSSKSSRKSGRSEVPQVVSYSSRFVDKISDVTRSMNISSGSSIKHGTVTSSGNSLSVDENKFSASDLNAVVSVKVINQTTVLDDNAEFSPHKEVKVENNEEFFDVYGDCYISGFILGGDFHGIVSIKVLDATHTEAVKDQIKGRFNVGSKSGGGDFHLGGAYTSSVASSYGAELWQSETTISVSWSGGGQIKKPHEEWSIDLLFHAAAGFPARVAACPQRTWAILSRYDNNLSFLKWAQKQKIIARDFTSAQVYVADLLDTYMVYKNNLMRIQDVLTRPTAYTLGPGNRPVSLTVAALVEERALIKAEMRKIMRQIDELNLDPGKLRDIEIRAIESPEVWATRLPVLKEIMGMDLTSAAMQMAKKEALKGFFFVDDSGTVATPKPAPPTPTAAIPPPPPVVIPTTAAEGLIPSPPAELCTPGVKPTLMNEELAFVSDLANRTKYQAYRFDMRGGNLTHRLDYNDVLQLEETLTPAGWPKRFEVRFASWSPNNVVESAVTLYDNLRLFHGHEARPTREKLEIDLAPGEVINKVKIGTSKEGWGATGVSYFEVWTSKGQNVKAGSAEVSIAFVECEPPVGFKGLKGLYGSEGEILDRIGVIWGRD